jgi:hypothetical protein
VGVIVGPGAETGVSVASSSRPVLDVELQAKRLKASHIRMTFLKTKWLLTTIFIDLSIGIFAKNPTVLDFPRQLNPDIDQKLFYFGQGFQDQ